jgi:hypothetical protein
MTLLAALGGMWLAARVIAPVTELARAVAPPPRNARRNWPAATAPGDEIDELAHAFDRYLSSGWRISSSASALRQPMPATNCALRWP